ncbi:hypothetical protein DU002_09855 [Corallincola holothuriorum]|uniref:Uncharacterized protein n=1 Tax=Corallincola holothuriorum TaxID=2282215 RepID=A0A368NKR3_9GAMM|nr:hypothetical protein [Corallincola holothuriorum]RCU49921.1 hypothetical protein DU002_09855 [Corallincola holothuriorum]
MASLKYKASWGLFWLINLSSLGAGLYLSQFAQSLTEGRFGALSAVLLSIPIIGCFTLLSRWSKSDQPDPDGSKPYHKTTAAMMANAHAENGSKWSWRDDKPLQVIVVVSCAWFVLSFIF